MLNIKTYKQRCIYLTFGALIFLFIVWNLALKKTHFLIKQNKELKHKIQLLDEAPKNIQQINQKLKTINYNNQEIKNTGSHEIIMEKSSSYSRDHKVTIREYPAEQVFYENEYILKTNVITVEGKFIDLLRYLHYLERNISIGKIVSASFYKREDIRSGTSKLYVKIYFQNIIHNK